MLSINERADSDIPLNETDDATHIDKMRDTIVKCMGVPYELVFSETKNLSQKRL